ncbi:trans-sialidase, partial [Trypanosoma conorhini]
MPRHLFSSAVPLLLCVLVCGSSGAAAEVQGGSTTAVTPFQGTREISVKWESSQSATSLRVPSLVEVGGEVFAVAAVQCRKESGCGVDCFTGIASKHLKKSEDYSTEMLAADAIQFDTQLLREGKASGGEAKDVMRPTTLVRGNEVYMLLGKYSRPPAAAQDANHWGLLLVQGTVTGSGDDKKIVWSETRAVDAASIGFHASLTELSGGGGSGLVLSDGTLVFPMQAINREKKSVLLAFRLAPSKKKWELSSGTTGAGCRDPSIVEWGEDGKLLAMAPCARGSYDVYPSTPRGVAWYTTGEPISRVWGTSPNRQGGDGVQSGFVTAEIEGKKVMLLTTPVYSEEEEGAAKGALHLWLTDNSRVHDVGLVSAAGDDAAASSLLYRSGAPA